MAKGDFYTNVEATQLTVWNTLINATAALGQLGVLPAEQTALQTMSDEFHAAVTAKVAARAAAQSATAACADKAKAAEALIRATARRLKAHAAYTVALGQQLGIEGPEAEPLATVVGADVRPDLELLGVIGGEVTIGFLKKGYSGVEIRSKRGAEVEYSFLARDTEAPYIDTRANLTAGPERREYVAYYLQKDGIVGQGSDVLVVTVPGT